ncbi:tetratricopeptide repeat protein [Pedobacter sp. AW1-32]|uniref:tetratricopeptide repeat protein n=1 Tax=Pedobacter sp. AW1-32 TaxID=3383026 RepID=UPI003FEFB06F
MKNVSVLIALMLMYFSGYSQDSAVLDKEKLFDFYQSQHYDLAADYLIKTAGADVADFKLLTQIGYCYLMAGKNAEAEKYYAKAYQLQPHNLPVLFSLGSIHNRRGNVEKAKFYYSEIVKIDSNNFNVYKILANLYGKSQDSLKLIYLIKANTINPAEGDVAADLADQYSAYQQYQKAYDVLNIALQADSDNLMLQREKLPIANNLKKYDEVIRSGERLLKELQDASVIKDVAKAYYFTKDYKNAVDRFNSLEPMHLENEMTLYYTALSYRALKNQQKATEYALKTIDAGISTNTSSYYGLLGLVYEEREKLPQALAAYKKGLQFKQNPSLYYRLAIYYDTKLKQEKKAQSYYNLYLKSKPDPKDNKDEIKFVTNRLAQINLPH